MTIEATRSASGCGRASSKPKRPAGSSSACRRPGPEPHAAADPGFPSPFAVAVTGLGILVSDHRIDSSNSSTAPSRMARARRPRTRQLRPGAVERSIGLRRSCAGCGGCARPSGSGV